MDIIENVHNKNRPMPEIFSRQDIRNTGGWDVGNVRAVRGERSLPSGSILSPGKRPIPPLATLSS